VTLERMEPRNEQPRKKVGFFGCNGQVVRVLHSIDKAHRTAPRRVELRACPACGHGHQAQPFWRMYRPDIDEGKATLKISKRGACVAL
jgi:hypothetical protein